MAVLKRLAVEPGYALPDENGFDVAGKGVPRCAFGVCVALHFAAARDLQHAFCQIERPGHGFSAAAAVHICTDRFIVDFGGVKRRIFFRHADFPPVRCTAAVVEFGKLIAALESARPDFADAVRDPDTAKRGAAKERVRTELVKSALQDHALELPAARKSPLPDEFHTGRNPDAGYLGIAECVVGDAEGSVLYLVSAAERVARFD